MKDPVLNKLKTDAGIVLADLWRAFTHQPLVEEWQHPRIHPAAPDMSMAETKSTGPSQSGLCYFHLN
jgi:hypothetical protein